MSKKQRVKKLIVNFLEVCKTCNVPFFIAVSIITFGLTFALNQVTEFRSDDLGFMIAWKTQRPTESFYDIIQTQIHQYFNWGGRTIAHTIARTLLWWKKPYSSIANALIIALLNILCCYYGKVKNNFTLLVATVLIYFLNADFDDTVNWITGSCTFVWPMIFCLLFLLPYLRILEDGEKGKRTSWLMLIWMLIAGVIAGWSNETIAPVSVLFVITTIIWVKKQKRNLPKWTYTGLAGVVVGTGFLMLSPGSSVRAEYIAEEINAGYSMLKTLMVRCYYMERAVFNYLFPTLLLGGVILLVLIYFYKQWPDIISVLFLGAGILSVGSMILSPTYPPRATFGQMIFFVIPVLRMTNQIVEKDERVYRIICSAAWFGYVAFVMQLLTQILYVVLKGV